MRKRVITLSLLFIGVCGICAQDSIMPNLVEDTVEAVQALATAKEPKEMVRKNVVELLKSIPTVFALLATPVLAILTHFGMKGSNAKRAEAVEAFNRIVTELSSYEMKRNLAAAIKIRRFFNHDIQKHSAYLKKESIKVISSLLRTLKTGVYQKTLADGLAYAQDLSLLDLQSTNLQNAYFGQKKEEKKKKVVRTKIGLAWQQFCQMFVNKWETIVRLVEIPIEKEDDKINANTHDKIRIHQTDFFLADLSYALFEYVDGDAYFRSAILCHTRFKVCDLRGADFSKADLSNVYFRKVKLKGANFSGAINVPEHLKQKLDAEGKFTEEIYTTPDVEDKPKRIFFSTPSIMDHKETYCKESLKRYLETESKKEPKEGQKNEQKDDKKYEIIPYTRDSYPKFGQVRSVAEKVKTADAMIVFGFKQTLVEKGCYRPNSTESNQLTDKWIPSPWNEIEVGMAVMLDIPIFMVKMEEDDLTTGIFDEVLSDTGIITYTVPEKADPIEWKGCNELQQFLSKLQSRNIMKLPKLEELGDVKLPSEWEKVIEDLAKQQHDRDTAVGTLKLIQKLGFTITKE